jgi:hypothetical protein
MAWKNLNGDKDPLELAIDSLKDTGDEDDDESVIDVVLEEIEEEENGGVSKDKEDEDDDEEQDPSSEEEEDDEEADKTKGEADPEGRGKKRKKPRGQQRIETLSRELREAKEAKEAALAALNAEKALREESQRDALYQTAEETTKRIKAEIKEKQNEIRGLDTDEDADKIFELNNELMGLTIDLRVAENTTAKRPKADPKAPPKAQPQRQPQEPNLPPAARIFIEDNRWISEPLTAHEELLSDRAKKLAIQYRRDGEDMDDPDTYEAIAEELREYATDKKIRVKGYYDAQKTKKQKAAGGAPAKQDGKAGKKRVVITKDEKELLERMNITTKEGVEAYIRNKRAREEAQTKGKNWR